MSYAELQITSNFSFLQGASFPEEYACQAQALGLKAIAITDHNTLAGIVRAHAAAKENNIQYIVGSKLSGFHLTAYPISKKGYHNLSRIITLGKRNTTKSDFDLTPDFFFKHLQDLLIILLPPSQSALKTQNSFEGLVDILKQIQPKNQLYLNLTYNYEVNKSSTKYILGLSKQFNLPLIASNDVYYHHPSRRPLQDILTCIRHHTNIHQAGFLLFKNSERCLKPPQEMKRLFHEHPNAIRNTLEVAEICSGFSLDQLQYHYPAEVCPENKNPFDYLRELTWQGAKQRYQNSVPKKVIDLLRHELGLIKELDYAKYFLTCYDIVKFARSQNILCQGRGAAANSAVCFVLGITAVDPDRSNMLFERFISKERSEPPDIDIDFEHERREEVIQYIYTKYGRERAALCAEIITYQRKSAVRDVGKAFGLAPTIVDTLAKSLRRLPTLWPKTEELVALGINALDHKIKNVFTISQELLGFPRHLGQHVGGFIISDPPLCELVPIVNASMPNRTNIEWDKDDIEVLRMLKIDILGLGMLSCIRKALSYVNQKRRKLSQSNLELASIPAEDSATYEMLCRSDSIGVFQVESRAQMSMLPRLKPRCFYDLVIEVAIVRPGPIQGNMVHPYLKRRDGLEKATYPDKRVEEILGHTLGVPLFQEQAMRLSIVLANFSADQAERLRRAMTAWKRNTGLIQQMKEKIIGGMLHNGYSLEFAESCFSQIRGFSDYGFPESHAASFALLVYASAWLKCHYPAEFACALLNSQPMGFYSPAQIVKDAQQHAVEVRPVDVSFSRFDCTIEEGHALRLGKRLVKGIGREDSSTTRAKLSLSQADAFQSFSLKRREALWKLLKLPQQARPLDNEVITDNDTTHVLLPELSDQQEVLRDYQALGLSLKGHPIQFQRTWLNAQKVLPISDLRSSICNLVCKVAGIILFLQRPQTAKGVTFITIEDETGMANLVLWGDIFEKYRNVIMQSEALIVEGKVERQTPVIYIKASRVVGL